MSFAQKEWKKKREPIRASKESLLKKSLKILLHLYILAIFVFFMAWQHIVIAVSCTVKRSGLCSLRFVGFSTSVGSVKKKNQIKTISWRFLSLEEIRTKTNVCEPNIQWLLTWRHYSEVESGRNFFRCIELWASKWESVNSCACWVMHPPPGRTVRIATAEFWFPVLVWDYILGFMLPLLIWWDKGKLSNWC